MATDTIMDIILGAIVIIGFVLFIITRITKKNIIELWKEMIGNVKEKAEDIKDVRRI